MGTHGYFYALLIYVLYSKSVCWNVYSKYNKKCFFTAAKSNLISSAWISWPILNCWVYHSISCISSVSAIHNTYTTAGVSYSDWFNQDLLLGKAILLNNLLVSITLLQTFELFLIDSIESHLLASVFLCRALLTFSTAFIYFSLNQMTCLVMFLLLCVSITSLRCILSPNPLLMITVVYELFAIMAVHDLSTWTLSPMRQEMCLQLSLPIGAHWIQGLLMIELCFTWTLLSSWTLMSLVSITECL